MNIQNFFNYNSHCPLCGNELTFFLQWFDDTNPWLTEKLFIRQDNVFREHPHHKQTNLFAQKMEDNKEFFFHVEHDKIKFNCQSAKKYLSSGTSYFYATCNPEAVTLDGDQFKVDLFNACYYRGSPYFTVSKIDLSMVNYTESFSLSNREDDLLKVYIVSQNYEDNTSSLFYYTADMYQEQDDLYMPEIFEKILPLSELDVSNKLKLIERLNTWINFS
jgi:hypothetical protein